MLFRMLFPKHDLRTTIINLYRGQGKRGEREIHINILKSGSIQLQGTKQIGISGNGRGDVCIQQTLLGGFTGLKVEGSLFNFNIG